WLRPTQRLRPCWTRFRFWPWRRPAMTQAQLPIAGNGEDAGRAGRRRPPPRQRGRPGGDSSSVSTTSPAATFQPPLLIWHGLGDTYASEGMLDLAEFVERTHPGTHVVRIRLNGNDAWPHAHHEGGSGTKRAAPLPPLPLPPPGVDDASAADAGAGLDV